MRKVFIGLTAISFAIAAASPSLAAAKKKSKGKGKPAAEKVEKSGGPVQGASCLMSSIMAPFGGDTKVCR